MCILIFFGMFSPQMRCHFDVAKFLSHSFSKTFEWFSVFFFFRSRSRKKSQIIRIACSHAQNGNEYAHVPCVRRYCRYCKCANECAKHFEHTKKKMQIKCSNLNVYLRNGGTRDLTPIPFHSIVLAKE